MHRIIVVGGGYAGLSALGRIRALDREVELVLVDPASVFTERVRLHEALAHGTTPTHAFAPLCTQLRVRHVGERALSIAPGRLVTDGGELPFDAAVVALGSVSKPLEGAQTLEDSTTAGALGRALSGRVCILGAGFTGIEVATELAAARPDLVVELVRRAPSWAGLSPKAADALDARLEVLGIEVTTSPTPGCSVVATIGFQARTLDGLTASDDGRVAVDDTLCALPGVFVAGDLARPPHDPGTGCVSAMPMGMVAGTNALAHVTGRPLVDFSLAKPIACLSLGAGYGLVQGLSHSAPTWSLHGRAAGLVKAGIVRYTTGVLALERWTGWPVYRWPTP